MLRFDFGILCFGLSGEALGCKGFVSESVEIHIIAASKGSIYVSNNVHTRPVSVKQKEAIRNRIGISAYKNTGSAMLVNKKRKLHNTKHIETNSLQRQKY